MREGCAIDGYGDPDVLIGIEMLCGSMFDDTLHGNCGRNILRGLAGDNCIDGRSGSDTLRHDRGANCRRTAGATIDLENGSAIDGWGGAGTLLSIETAEGSDSKDLIYRTTSHCELIGKAGSDRICGNDGREMIAGGKGNDKPVGSLGHDTQIGAKGDDGPTGGAGNDTFAFKFNFGGDTITDFGTGDDVTDLAAANSIASFADLLAPHATSTSEGMVIDADHGNRIPLANAGQPDLSESDFQL
ncbi:calcium-binding protein [Mangrovicoccus sp. HB161399]|uniref:calcium-binding protein n=1 Tax=Mangrovicoccus sp. HB161399 TaxID=2720392 RepID=UPI0015569FF1|nr:calcium-binding protein [Mangrovicoccus sp. HB161399]